MNPISRRSEQHVACHAFSSRRFGACTLTHSGPAGGGCGMVPHPLRAGVPRLCPMLSWEGLDCAACGLSGPQQTPGPGPGPGALCPGLCGGCPLPPLGLTFPHAGQQQGLSWSRCPCPCPPQPPEGAFPRHPGWTRPLSLASCVICRPWRRSQTRGPCSKAGRGLFLWFFNLSQCCFSCYLT